MDIESIKKVKLLVSLKGTEEGKQTVWLKGTVFDKNVKPFPSTIIEELRADRIPKTLEILEADPEEFVEMVIEVVEDEVSTDTVKIDAEKKPPAPPIVEPAKETSEAPKGDSPILTTSRRRRR